MIISDKYELVFITTPKSGSHTGFTLMQQYFEAPNTHFNHRRSISGHAQKYFSFTFVRNPFERFCALYHACIVNDRKGFIPKHVHTIQEYGKYMSKINQTNILRLDLQGCQSAWHKNSLIQRYVPIEIAEETLNIWYPDKDIKLPHELKREHPTWKDVMNDELKQYVITWAQEDFKRYGYHENYCG